MAHLFCWPGVTFGAPPKCGSTWLHRWRFGALHAAARNAEWRMMEWAQKVQVEPEGNCRILLVRDPYIRALSAWADKASRGHGGCKARTLAEWMDGLHADRENRAEWDHHWRPFTVDMRGKWDMTVDIDCPHRAILREIVNYYDLPEPPPPQNQSDRKRMPLRDNARLANLARVIWAEDYRWIEENWPINR